MFIGNQTVGTKQLTFFFSFERPRRLKACCGLIKACCGLIKAFGEGWLRQRVSLTERTMRWRSRWVRAWVTWRLICVRWERESVRVCVRLLCVREKVRVRVSESADWFVWGEWGVIFEFTFFEIEYQTLGFTLSKPSLWGSRSMWCVHVELKF